MLARRAWPYSGEPPTMIAYLQVGLCLLAAIAAVGVAANRLHVPPSIFLVLAGLALALVPGLPPLELIPELVLLLVLPPIIYSAGVSMSWREFRFNLRPIALLAIGCVVFTTVRRRGERALALGLAMGSRLRSRRHHRAAGRRRTPGDCEAVGLATPAARHSRGRRSRQRRHGTGPLPLRSGRCQHGCLFLRRRHGALRADPGGRARLRDWRRLVHAAPAPCRRRSARRDPALAADALHRLLATRGARRLGRARHRHRGTLCELERTAADHRRPRDCRASSSGISPSTSSRACSFC